MDSIQKHNPLFHNPSIFFLTAEVWAWNIRNLFLCHSKSSQNMSYQCTTLINHIFLKYKCVDIRNSVILVRGNFITFLMSSYQHQILLNRIKCTYFIITKTGLKWRNQCLTLRDKSDRINCVSLGPSWCNKKIVDPER